jgi:cytochrome c
MKKILVAISAFALLTGCGNEQKSEYARYYDKDYKPDTTAVASRAQPARPATTPPDKTAATVDSEAATAAAPAAAAPPAAEPKQAQAGQFAKGEQLIAKFDCLTCHKVDQKVVGPAYVEVAQKYEANDKNISYLAGKIIKGGSGVWGQVPMTPHPNVSEGDAKEMARYILSLRK